MEARRSIAFLFLGFLCSSEVEACSPSGRIRGKTPRRVSATPGTNPNAARTVRCILLSGALPMTSHTRARLTLKSFEKGGDGGGPSECDKQDHSNDIPVVALLIGWINHKGRCLRNITIYGNGISVAAMVVNECDSTEGCVEDHDYQPTCDNDIVDASRAMWKAFGVSKDSWGWLDITWT